MTDTCYCGSAMPYAHCCEPFHKGLTHRSELPKTAEQLMRSRYAAFVLGLEEYLLASWHPSTRPESLKLDQQQGVKWLGLKIKQTEAGGTNDSQGRVEFVARYKINGKATRLHENSRFIKENDQWFYVDGEMKS